MSWAIGEHNGRDIGYGVPAICDQPGCQARIDRGLSYVCGSAPYGGEVGCGLFFCSAHRGHWRKGVCVCTRCANYRTPYEPKPDTKQWIRHKLTHVSWSAWRTENREWVEKQSQALGIQERR